MTRLMNDICRCHDNTCKLRETCARYLQRHTGSERTSFAATLKDSDLKCSAYWPQTNKPTEQQDGRTT